MCLFQSFLYFGKVQSDGFCSNGLVSLFKIFLRAGRRLKTRVRVIVFALLFFKGFLENRTGATVRGPGPPSAGGGWGGAAAPSVLPWGSARGRREPGWGAQLGARTAPKEPYELLARLRTPEPCPLAWAPRRGKEVREAAALLLPGDGGRAGAERRWRRGGCGGCSVRCGVWRERGRESPDLLLVLFLGVFIPEGCGKRGHGRCYPSGCGRVGAVQRETVSLHAVIAWRVHRTLPCSSAVFPQLVRVEGIVKNRWLGFGGRARRVSSLKSFKAWKLQRNIIGKHFALPMFASLDLKTVIAFSQIEKIGFSEALNCLLCMHCLLDLLFRHLSPPDTSEALSQTKLRLFCARRWIIMFCTGSWFTQEVEFCYVAVFECLFHLLWWPLARAHH